MNNPVKYAISDGNKLIILTKATSLEAAASFYLKKMLKEYFPDEPEKWQLNGGQNLQLAYDDWCETAFENMENDGYRPGKYIEPVENMLDNWSNRYWIATKVGAHKWDAINNSEQYQLLKDTFNKYAPNIIERELTISE